jgi:hypothetical protein
MGSEFTIIIDQRQHFGNDPDSLPDAFVGAYHQYEFAGSAARGLDCRVALLTRDP